MIFKLPPYERCGFTLMKDVDSPLCEMWSYPYENEAALIQMIEEHPYWLQDCIKPARIRKFPVQPVCLFIPPSLIPIISENFNNLISAAPDFPCNSSKRKRGEKTQNSDIPPLLSGEGGRGWGDVCWNFRQKLSSKSSFPKLHFCRIPAASTGKCLMNVI